MPEVDPVLEEDFLQTSLLPGSNPLAMEGNLYIYSPDAMGSLSPTARAILDELKDWHRRVEKHGSREIHPSYLLTLDRIPEVLNKFNTLSQQAKTETAIHNAIKQIIDYDKKGQNRVAYIYPFLVRDGVKIKAKICLFAPQKESKTDAAPFRKSCLQASQELMDIILSQRAKKIRTLDEENPGNFLFAKTKTGEEWLFPKLGSLETEINQIVRKAFLPIQPIPIPEFAQDFMNYAKHSKSVIEILPDYHVIVDELQLNEDGSFRSQPEIVNQFRAQLDGLEKFAQKYLRKLSEEMNYTQFIENLEDFHKSYSLNAEPGRKQSAEKAEALIKLVESFPFDQTKTQLAKKVQETINLSARILKKLIQEKDMILDRKDESLYIKIRKELLERIPEFTKNNNTLMKIDFEQEIRKMGIQDESRVTHLAERLKEDVCSKFSYHEVPGSEGKSIFYVVDHGYMAAVMHKLTSDSDKHPELSRQLEIAKIIFSKLSNPKHPELNSKLNPENIVKLNMDIREIERVKQERLRNQEFQKKINIPAGLLTFIACVLIFLTASFNFQSIIPIVFGVPFSIVIAVMAAFFFREKSREELRQEILESGKYAFSGSSSGSGNSGGIWRALFGGEDTGKARKSSDSSEEVEEESRKSHKIVEIYKAADGFIFPNRFNKITDKVLDLKTIQERIYASLSDIRRRNLNLAKEKDDDKVASTVEYALIQSCSVINIPTDIAIRNMPNTLYILKNDLKSPLFREQLAEAYREELNKKKFDKKLVKYYTYLINTIEMEYYKYLPRKKL